MRYYMVWGSLDHAEWLADKIHNGGDYAKEAASLLVYLAKRVPVSNSEEKPRE
jgi:hypothetical protein